MQFNEVIFEDDTALTTQWNEGKMIEKEAGLHIFHPANFFIPLRSIYMPEKPMLRRSLISRLTYTEPTKTNVMGHITIH